LPTHDSNEQDLQQRIRAGDESAFETVFRANYARLVRTADSIVRERASAEEIAQEVMLELWRRRESLQLEQTFAAYLIRSTRNRALNHVRHQRVVARELAAATLQERKSQAADAEMLGVELAGVVREAIDALPELTREVFQLSRVQGLRYIEIASVLGISVKTVEKRMGQALAELKDRLEPWLNRGGRKPA